MLLADAADQLIHQIEPILRSRPQLSSLSLTTFRELESQPPYSARLDGQEVAQQLPQAARFELFQYLQELVQSAVDGVELQVGNMVQYVSFGLSALQVRVFMLQLLQRARQLDQHNAQQQRLEEHLDLVARLHALKLELLRHDNEEEFTLFGELDQDESDPCGGIFVYTSFQLQGDQLTWTLREDDFEALGGSRGECLIGDGSTKPAMSQRLTVRELLMAIPYHR